MASRSTFTTLIMPYVTICQYLGATRPDRLDQMSRHPALSVGSMVEAVASRDGYAEFDFCIQRCHCNSGPAVLNGSFSRAGTLTYPTKATPKTLIPPLRALVRDVTAV